MSRRLLARTKDGVPLGGTSITLIAFPLRIARFAEKLLCFVRYHVGAKSNFSLIVESPLTLQYCSEGHITLRLEYSSSSPRYSSAELDFPICRYNLCTLYESITCMLMPSGTAPMPVLRNWTITLMLTITFASPSGCVHMLFSCFESLLLPELLRR